MKNNFNQIIRELVNEVYKNKISNNEKENIIMSTIFLTNKFDKILKNINAPVEKEDFMLNIYTSYCKSLDLFNGEKASIVSFTSLILKRDLMNFTRTFYLKKNSILKNNFIERSIDIINEYHSKSIENEYLESIIWDDFIKTKSPNEQFTIKKFLEGYKRIDLCNMDGVGRNLADKCWKEMKIFKKNLLNNI